MLRNMPRRFATLLVLLICLPVLFVAASTNAAAQNAGEGKIAFVRNDDIYVMNADGTDVRRLTSGAEKNVDPTWSPDGTRIAFSSNRAADGKFHIYVMNADGSGVTQLTARIYGTSVNFVGDAKPVWSPDGTRIAFYGSRGLAEQEVDDDYVGLYLMNADGSGQKNIYFEDVRYLHRPTWSPDTSTLAFSGDDRIVFIGLNGNQRTGVRSYRPLDTSLNGVSWSPDGQRLAAYGFTQSTRYPSTFTGFFLFNDGIAGLTEIVSSADIPSRYGSSWNDMIDGRSRVQTAWSPDGKKIILSRGEEIFLFNADGSELKFLTAGSQAVWQPRATTTAPASTIQFSNLYLPAAYENRREGQTIRVGVTRLGDTSTNATIDFATESGTAVAGLDFFPARGTLRFAPGQSTASFDVQTLYDNFLESDETFIVRLSNPNGGAILTNRRQSVVEISNQGGYLPSAGDPINDVPFFVNQHYFDFLGRAPDPAGYADWIRVFELCGTDRTCLENARINVSASFFRSQEFQQKGFYIYRFYKAAFGRRPTYVEYSADVQPFYNKTAAQVQARRDAFPEEFAARSEFKAKYDTLSNVAFVNELLRTAGVEVNRDGFVADLNAGRKTRSQVLREVVESRELAAKDYNEAFVTMQYFGYLRRDPEQSGFDAWLRVLERNPSDYRTMVKGFVNSIEYRKRFGTP